MKTTSLLALFFLSLTAPCTGKDFKMPSTNDRNPYNLEFSSLDYAFIQGTSKKIRFNPNPKKVYEVTIQIHGSPMPLLPSETPTVTYNSDCRYTVGLIHLYSHTPITEYKAPITQIDENTYKLLYIQDAILDEDYGLKYEGKSLGICHWKASGMGLTLTPTGNPQYYSILINAISRPETFAKQLANPIQTYYFEKKYVTTQPRRLHSDGTPFNSYSMTGKKQAELANHKPEDLFTVTVSIKGLSK